MQVAGAERERRGDGAVEHEVGAGERQGHVLARGGLTLGEVDHHHGAAAAPPGTRRGRRGELGGEREARAAAPSQPDGRRALLEVGEGDPGERAVLGPVGGEPGTCLDATQQRGPGKDVHVLGGRDGDRPGHQVTPARSTSGVVVDGRSSSTPR